jgi:RNA polymerase sigma-70 factor, ECF subfamily
MSLTQEEETLLHKIKLGDSASYQLIFEKYYKELCITAHFIVNDKDEAEEIVQGLFVKIWEQREFLSINTSIKSYLNTSVKNSCKNHLAHQKIKKQYQTSLLNHSQYIGREGLFTDPILLERIQSSIESLPPKCKEIFQLNRFKGYKYKEIAEKLNISQKTVEAQMGKALSTLYQALKEYLPLLLVLAYL